MALSLASHNPIGGTVFVRGVTESRVTMLPKLELHRGSSMEISSGARVGHQVELEEELEEEVERRVRRNHSRNKTQVRMHG